MKTKTTAPYLMNNILQFDEKTRKKRTIEKTILAFMVLFGVFQLGFLFGAIMTYQVLNQ